MKKQKESTHTSCQTPRETHASDTNKMSILLKRYFDKTFQYLANVFSIMYKMNDPPR